MAREEKILSEEEIGAVESIVMAVSAGRVGAQFREAAGKSDPGISCGNTGNTDDDDDGAC